MCSITIVFLINILMPFSEEIIAIEDTTELCFNDLPLENQKVFLENTESDENGISTRARKISNVVSMFGASKKYSKTKGKVLLHLTSYKESFKSAHARVTGGGKSWTKNNIKGSGKSMAITIPVSYTGKQKYFHFKGSVQYVTAAGPGSISSNAGAFMFGR